MLGGGFFIGAREEYCFPSKIGAFTVSYIATKVNIFYENNSSMNVQDTAHSHIKHEDDEE